MFCSSSVAQGNVDKLIFVDIAESSTKGGIMDLEIFNLPKVEVSKGITSGRLDHGLNLGYV